MFLFSGIATSIKLPSSAFCQPPKSLCGFFSRCLSVLTLECCRNLACSLCWCLPSGLGTSSLCVAEMFLYTVPGTWMSFSVYSMWSQLYSYILLLCAGLLSPLHRFTDLVLWSYAAMISSSSWPFLATGRIQYLISYINSYKHSRSNGYIGGSWFGIFPKHTGTGDQSTDLLMSNTWYSPCRGLVLHDSSSFFLLLERRS